MAELQAPPASLREQRTRPGGIFPLLRIFGSDVVQLALANLAGEGLTPLAVSFGSVAHAISAALLAVGENGLVMGPAEIPLLVIDLKSGSKRVNQSWVLGRLFKTYETWMAHRHDKAEYFQANQEPRANPLCVAMYEWSRARAAGVPARDWVWWSGVAVTAVQLSVAAVPLGLGGNWTMVLVTAAGTALSYASGSLPQWRREKWHARRLDEPKAVALTLGNGSGHVAIVRGLPGDLDLEELAAARAPDESTTRALTMALALLWMALLVTSMGIQAHAWLLLVVGALGMLHNLVVARASRRPPALGLPLKLMRTRLFNDREAPAVIARENAMWTLMELEGKYMGHGKALLDEFFPEGLLKWEQDWWNNPGFLERARLYSEAQSEAAAGREAVLSWA